MPKGDKSNVLSIVNKSHIRIGNSRWATHLFEEPGAIEEVAALTKAWFSKYLK